MKSPVLAGLLVLSSLAAAAHAAFLIQPNDVVALCGDSITEQRLYTVYVEDYLLMCQPTEGQRILQQGWGGERVPAFLERLKTDVFPFKPTVVTTCYGMNDGSYVPLRTELLETYRASLTDTVDALRKGGVREIVLGTPGCVDPATFRKQASAAEYNETLRVFGEAARDVAEKTGVHFADLHTPMMDAMTKSKAFFGKDYGFIGTDGIHPSFNGQFLMAQAMLQGLGCDGAIGTITLDLASNRAEGTPGQKIVSAASGTVEVESTRYPFCLEGTAGKPEPSPAAIVAFTSFTDDLNRYLLVVKGLPGTKGKVTWSSPDKTVSLSQEFAVADLEKGVNLAALAGRNPFTATFNKVNEAVRTQQLNEVYVVKSFLHNFLQFKQLAPGRNAEWDGMAAAVMERDNALYAAAAALVVPVRHTIQVEAVP
ncbi:Lysophospholipase L1 [Verrucomicrobium sp. GAS474]|uniref:SGNH/GDSL hydrolase family protein n=1 Tax=Verrucomicrobium sp. GAS474 TaxID=1882831 RepID=UPI00087CD1E9|nr:SGNH/GDSL hydrolase family protein [Verrucomicrobium sp. GAS474]SDT92899.1 Lysophospholipase L1 [Verrucomicrobium sp. GAS474]